MRRNRILWFLLWVLSLVGISFYGGTVSYGLFTLISLVPLFSLAYLLYVYAFFRVYQELGTKELVVDQTVPFFFHLRNEYPLGFVGIRVRFFSSFSTINGLDDGVEYELLPGTGIRRETTLVCKYRGEYEIGIKTIEIRDYFKLFRLSYHNPERLRVTVKPKLIYPDALGETDSLQESVRDFASNPTEAGILIRDYVTGDDIRHIHWKTTARMGELQVRKPEGEEKQGVGIVMSTKRLGKTQEEYLPGENKLLEINLALVMYMLTHNTGVYSLCLQDGPRGYYLQSQSRFDAYYGAMSAIEFDSDKRDELFMPMAAGEYRLLQCKIVYILVQEWTPETEDLVKFLTQNNTMVQVYLVSDAKAGMPSVETIPRLRLTRVEPKADLREVQL